MFEGSGIIETLEEARNSGLLKYSDDPVLDTNQLIPIYRKGFLGRKEIDHHKYKVIADYDSARIQFGIGSVRVDYDYWSTPENGDHGDDDMGYTSLIVLKNEDDTFELSKILCGKSLRKDETLSKTIGNSEKMIDLIALAIAESQIKNSK